MDRNPIVHASIQPQRLTSYVVYNKQQNTKKCCCNVQQARTNHTCTHDPVILHKQNTHYSITSTSSTVTTITTHHYLIELCHPQVQCHIIIRCTIPRTVHLHVLSTQVCPPVWLFLEIPNCPIKRPIQAPLINAIKCKTIAWYPTRWVVHVVYGVGKTTCFSHHRNCTIPVCWVGGCVGWVCFKCVLGGYFGHMIWACM